MFLMKSTNQREHPLPDFQVKEGLQVDLRWGELGAVMQQRGGHRLSRDVRHVPHEGAGDQNRMGERRGVVDDMPVAPSAGMLKRPDDDRVTGRVQHAHRGIPFLRLPFTLLYVAFEELYVAAEEILDATCAVCPAQLLPLGQFDVDAGPSRQTRYEPERGWRVNTVTGAPTCVHPYRVGLPAARYASDNLPVPQCQNRPKPTLADVALPDDPTLLEAWMVAILRTSPPQALASALLQAEAKALQRFDSRDVLAALRRVMSHELTR